MAALPLDLPCRWAAREWQTERKDDRRDNEAGISPAYPVDQHEDEAATDRRSQVEAAYLRSISPA
ncbi:MAG: hypothetical protein EOO38_13745 [Cytophagaceae bacterium]|nr:MAG: hypothetical protein EOO38_13745 [Cytophagaceae bacterium]